jgi:hypothetical protein
VELRIPEDFAIEAFVAIGKQGDKTTLPAELQEREIPNGRLPINELVLEGGFFPREGGK